MPPLKFGSLVDKPFSDDESSFFDQSLPKEPAVPLNGVCLCVCACVCLHMRVCMHLFVCKREAVGSRGRMCVCVCVFLHQY